MYAIIATYLQMFPLYRAKRQTMGDFNFRWAVSLSVFAERFR